MLNFNKKPNRPSWDDYFFEIAKLVVTRATCPRKQVGSVLVKNKRIISSGYNGAREGEPHCIDNECILVNNHCKRAVHSEINALKNALIPAYGATLYCTHQPCAECETELYIAGVRDIRVIGKDKWELKLK